MALALLSVVIALSCRLSSAQPSTCSTTPPSSLQGVPTVNYAAGWNPSNTLRPQIGYKGTNSWSVYSATEAKIYGMWCQVRNIHNAGMGSNIGDWYYPPGNTTDGFSLASSSSTPYQSLKCTDQIGLALVGDVTNNQGIVRCITSVPNLSRSEISFGVYSDSVFNAYSGPTVDSSMSLHLESSRDADEITFMLSFVVSFGPPSRVTCRYNNPGDVFLFSLRDHNIAGILFRDVVRSQYVSSSQPDMTRVRARMTQPREPRAYTCQVTVEGRVGIGSGAYTHNPIGSGSSSATVTVAGTPVGVTASRTDSNSILVSWTAPSPEPAGYEVFFQTTAASSRLSGGNTSNTELTLTGLTLGETYSIIVVAFGAPGAPVLPSAHSSIAMVTLSVPQLESSLTLAPTSSSIAVSWTPPQFTPDSYTISHSCQSLENSSQPATGSTSIISNGAATAITIFFIDPNSACTVSLTAVFSGVNSNTVTSSTNTTSVIDTLTTTSVINALTTTSVIDALTSSASSIPLSTTIQTSTLMLTTTLPTQPPTTSSVSLYSLLIMVGAPVLGGVLLLMIMAIILITGILVWRRRRSNKGKWASSSAEFSPKKKIKENNNDMKMTSCGAYDSHTALMNDNMPTDECAAYGANEPKVDDDNYYEMLPVFDPKQPQLPPSNGTPIPSSAPQQQPAVSGSTSHQPANYEIPIAKSNSGQQQPAVYEPMAPPPSNEQPVYL